MTSIPLMMLRHKCMLTVYENDGIFGERRAADEIMLKNVYVSLWRKKITSAGGEHEKISGMLYYDCQKSAPSDVHFAVGASVFFEGMELRITQVKLLYDGVRLHHIEVKLGQG